jgi:hypothetical protein
MNEFMESRIEVGFETGSMDALAARYQSAEPFPHIHLERFLDPSLARELAREFPRAGTAAWTQYKHYNENKLGLTKRDQLPNGLGRLIDELNGPEFTAALSRLTGIPNLIADPTLEGGGLHQSGPRGFLNIHADFTVHHHHSHWRRRVNLILYLNEGWAESWGGAIELWDRGMTHCVTKIAPLLNHAVIFSTDEDSYHGFPDALTCPEGVTRKSVALYYYTEEAVVNARFTNYRARPEDARSKAALIWADKQAVSAYSKLKRKLGLSDNFASSLLALISRSEE